MNVSPIFIIHSNFVISIKYEIFDSSKQCHKIFLCVFANIILFDMKDFERDKNVISQLHNIFDLRLRKHCRMYFSLVLRGDNLVITTLPVQFNWNDIFISHNWMSPQGEVLITLVLDWKFVPLLSWSYQIWDICLHYSSNNLNRITLYLTNFNILVQRMFLLKDPSVNL